MREINIICLVLFLTGYSALFAETAEVKDGLICRSPTVCPPKPTKPAMSLSLQSGIISFDQIVDFAERPSILNPHDEIASNQLIPVETGSSLKNPATFGVSVLRTKAGLAFGLGVKF